MAEQSLLLNQLHMGVFRSAFRESFVTALFTAFSLLSSVAGGGVAHHKLRPSRERTRNTMRCHLRNTYVP